MGFLSMFRPESELQGASRPTPAETEDFLKLAPIERLKMFGSDCKVGHWERHRAMRLLEQTIYAVVAEWGSHHG